MLLLCTTDESIAGEAALRVGADLAERLHAELVTLDADTRDPAPQIVAAARATGCDLVVVGFAARSRLGGSLPPAWQRRLIGDAPCPVMLVPVGSVVPRGGGIVLGYDVPELPHQAARVAGRLARRLGAPLIITHVLSTGMGSRQSTGWQLYRGARVLAREAERAAGGSLALRHAAYGGEPSEGLARAAAAHEAALVVIGGRGRGRTLLPRRRAARPPALGARLPVVVTSAQPQR